MVKIGIFALSVSCSKSGKLQAKIETMDRGMICPSLVFDHFRYSPNCAFEYQHEDGVVVFVSFVSKVFPDT